MPTSPAISPTFVFRVSNIPVRFEMIPSMSSSLNHSWIISNIKGDHLLCGGSRCETKAPAGFGATLGGGGQQTGQQGDQGDDQSLQNVDSVSKKAHIHISFRSVELSG